MTAPEQPTAPVSPFPGDPASWPTGLSDRVEPLVRRVLAPNPSPYTATGTQTYVIALQRGLCG